MALAFLVVFATTHFENAYFLATTMSNDFSCYFCAFDKRCAYFYRFAVSNHQNFSQFDLAVEFGWYLFYFQFFANGNFILFAAGFYDRVHTQLHKDFGFKKIPRTMREKRGILLLRGCFVKLWRRLVCGRRCEMFAVFFQTAFDAIIACLFFCKTVCRAESVMLENLPYFQQNLAADLGRVDVVINRAVQSEVALISQIGTYIISAGGKRLRPVITILSGRALGCDNDGLYSLAAMVEFIHTSTLLHDDVVDESELRRGRKTANNLFGNAAAVLVGDFLYTRAFQLMVGSGSMKILEVMADATNIIAEGEVMQLMNIGNIDITEAQYLQVIQYKTAKLFEAAAQVGAILAGASAEQEAALRDYGMYVGTAFQIIDDVLDYSGDPEQIGKNVGDDLAEGKPTLPLIYLMNQGSQEAAADVRAALQNADRSYFEKIHAHVAASDALSYCIEQAKAAAGKAAACLDVLPDNEATRAMRQLAEVSVARVM